MSKDAIGSTEISRPAVVGTGLVALDIVFGSQAEESIGRWAGGTCGNVLTILSCLGWASYPVARLAEDEQALDLRQDLSSWGVHLDYVYQAASGSTPVILQHIRRDDRGEIIHKFSFKCPRLRPSVTEVSSGSQAGCQQDACRTCRRRKFSSSIGARAPRLTWLLGFRAGGAIVVFEPPSQGDPALFEQAAGLAHIVKYSHERWMGRKARLQGTAIGF